MSWGAVAGAAVVTAGGLIADNQKRQAAKGATNDLESMSREALAEEQRQFDIQNEEYQRKQSMLEDQQKQVITQLAPYVQGGQSAFYQMLALNGLAAPTGTMAQAAQVETPTMSVQSPTAGPTQIAPGTSSHGILGSLMEQIAEPAAANAKAERMATTVPNAVNPYAGMTGEEAQKAAIEGISSSPILQELTRQGEEAMLQQSAATGGLRGGNTEAALAQFRPQMLQNEIDKQYARLSGISGTGMQAIGMNPMPNPGSVPYNPNIGSTMQDIGAINAGNILSEGQAAGQMYGNIASGIGYGIGQYQNRPVQTSNPAGGQGGMQVVGFDAYGNPIAG